MAYFPKSQTDKWGTPPDLYQALDAEFHFDSFDPCPMSWNKGDPDGLLIEWTGDRIFVNPPYTNVKAWAAKCHEEFLKGKLIVLLTNNYTDSPWFHEFVYGKHEVRFIKGRVKFVRVDGTVGLSNPRGSMISIFRPNANEGN